MLDRYRDQLCTFNDDIQGTAAVTTGTLLAAVARTGGRLRDQRVAILGAGSAGCGIAEQMVAAMVEEGLSDREAVERFKYDLRWKYAAGGLDFDHPGFVHTVLVEMRARLRNSARPDRIFEAALAVAKEAGLIGRRRVIDSTALYDAVATQDTVTMIRAAIRQV